MHYPTVEDIGGVRIRTENGKAVRQGDGVVVYFDVVSTGKFGDTIGSVAAPVAREARSWTPAAPRWPIWRCPAPRR